MAGNEPVTYVSLQQEQSPESERRRRKATVVFVCTAAVAALFVVGTPMHASRGVKKVRNQMTVAAMPEMQERTAGQNLDNASVTDIQDETDVIIAVGLHPIA